MALLGLMCPDLLLCKPRGETERLEEQKKDERGEDFSVTERAAFIHELRQDEAVIWIYEADSVIYSP